MPECQGYGEESNERVCSTRVLDDVHRSQRIRRNQCKMEKAWGARHVSSMSRAGD